MASSEGIIFADLFINNKEFFIQFFSQYYQENKQRIDPVIIELETILNNYNVNTITTAMAESFKIAWKNFQRIVLLNDGDLQLLVAYRGKGGHNPTFSQIIKQEDVEGEEITPRGRQYGIRSGDNLIKETMAALKASQIEKFLQKHINDFLNQLQSTIGSSTAEKIHRYHEYCLTLSLQNSTEHITGKQWYEAFYTASAGQYFGGKGLGQAYDAFMNHLANKEKGIFDFLTSNGLKDASFQKIGFQSQSVYFEEGGVEGPWPGSNFAELLKESRNHIGWYTGGDIVIVSPETMQIVYNIQLKTTTEKSLSVFNERVSAIRTFLKGFLLLTPEEKGERVFEFFLTSVSNYDDFNSAPQQEIDALLQQELGKKIPINLKF